MKISLRVTHPSVDPRLVCENIDLPVVRTWAVGEQRKTPKGNQLAGLYDCSYCVFSIKEDENNFESSILDILNYLNRKKDFLSLLADTGGQVSLYITLSGSDHYGVSLDNCTIGILADLKIQVMLDIYADKR